MFRPRRVAALVVLLALLGGAAARANRPPRFGDEVTVGSSTAAVVRYQLGANGALEAYDARSGAEVWSYRRTAGTPVGIVPVAGGAVAVWSDGMLTAVQPGSPQVRWHRFVPSLGVETVPTLAPASGGSVLLVLAPKLVMVFRVADGNLRWDTQPPPGCSYDPDEALAVDGAYVVPRPCVGEQPSALEAFDSSGHRWRITTAPEAVPLPLDATHLALRQSGPDPHPHALDAATGRRLPSCSAPPVALLAAGGCADPAR